MYSIFIGTHLKINKKSSKLQTKASEAFSSTVSAETVAVFVFAVEKFHRTQSKNDFGRFFGA